MKYIFCYRLNRKNARRKEFMRQEYKDKAEAIVMFRRYCEGNFDGKRFKEFELLTGDWKHISYYNTDGLHTEPMKKFTPIDKYKGANEILKLYFGMSEKMQKVVKEIMEIEQEEKK